MKKNLSVLLLVFICGITLSLSARESEFERWVIRTTEYLDQKGKVVQTSFGPIQYVWKGDRKKPVVVCIQGAFGGWDQSLLMGENLLDEGFSVLAISRPGYLASTYVFPGIMPNSAQASAIIEVLDALHIDKASFIGFSAGAPVAFQIANLFPERVSALVLESIGAHNSDILFYIFLANFLEYEQLTGDVSTLDFETYMLFLTTQVDFYSTAKKILSMDNDLPEGQLAERIAYVTHSPSQSCFLKKLIFSLMPLSPRLNGIENDVLLAASGNWPQDPTFYQNIITPTVIVQGVHDTNGNFSTAVYVNSQISGSKLIAVEGCGHFIWLGVNTNKWERQVTQFLKKHSH